MIRFIFLVICTILYQVHGTKVVMQEVLCTSNLKYANVTATLGKNINNDTYFNSTVETFVDLSKMLVSLMIKNYGTIKKY